RERDAGVNFQHTAGHCKSPEFIDVKIEQDDLNQKLLTNLAPEWLMHTIVWRNRSDLDTMSLDELCNHLKVYEREVQKKSDSQNMAFISSAKNSSGNGEVNTASIPTASTQVSPASANVAVAALLSMRVERYWKKTGKKISIQGTDVAGFDKSKVECFNCHKICHFSKECRASRIQDRGIRENYIDGSKEEEHAPKALMAIDRVGCTQVSPASANVAVAGISLDTTCAYIASQSNGSQIKYKDINQIDEDDIEEMDIKWSALTATRYATFLRSAGLLGSKTGSYMENEEENHALVADKEAPTEFALMAKSSSDNEVTPSIESNSNNLQNNSSSVSENGESTSSILSKPEIKFVKATDSPTVIKTNKDETIRKSFVKYAKMYRKTSKSSNVRGNQRNWNNLKCQQLGKNFLMKNKACFNYGDFNHLSYNYGKWVEKGKLRLKNNTHKSIPPRTVFHKFNRTPMRINRPHMNDAQPKRTYFSKPTNSYVSRPFRSKSTVKTQVRVPRVPTVNRKFPTVNRKVPTGNSKVSTADLGNKGKTGNSQNNIDNKGYWDSGCSRHMTSNISYLSDYKPYDGGYVSFCQGGCKITGKGTIKTDKLEFKNVYFVKDLKYNLFSVSQICDNKYSVTFIDSECIVLGRDFKLRDDTNVLLRTPRQHNIYSIDLNNIVPYKYLTCLVAKASADESELWHRRLGHLNFKTMNKLVRHNLVRGLPSNCFENDQTCAACLNGKQHKASCKTKFTWTFFLKTKDETSGILRNFITEIENLKDLKPMGNHGIAKWVLEGGDNRLRLGCLVAAGSGAVVAFLASGASLSEAVLDCLIINVDAPEGYIPLYFSLFNIGNLRLPLNNFCLDVSEFFKCHFPLLKPFGVAYVTTFAVACKAYGGKATVPLFRSFLTFGPASYWLTFHKRPDPNIPLIFETWPNSILLCEAGGSTINVGSLLVDRLKAAVDNDQVESSSVLKDKDASSLELTVIDKCFSRQNADFAEGSKKRRSMTETLEEEATVVRPTTYDNSSRNLASSSDYLAFDVEEAYSAHNKLFNLHDPLLKDKLGFLTFDELFNVYDVHALQLASKRSLLEHKISKLENSLSKARKNHHVEGSQIGVEMRYENPQNLKELSMLSNVVASAEESRKRLSEELEGLKPRVEKVVDLFSRLKAADLKKAELVKDLLPMAVKKLVKSEHFSYVLGNLQQKPITFGRSQALDEVHGLGDSWDFKDVQDYHPEAEKIFDEAVEAFYKLKFPYISLLVEKAGQSFKELAAVDPPSFQETFSI
nr:ribonuclease H-like domain-containing protein [Tanacetum cinerariifolium]